jgi:hypothetical protein
VIALLLVAAATVSLQPTAPAGPYRHLDKSILNALAEATSVAKLDAQFLSLPAPNGIERIVYATRRSQLAPGHKSDDLLIAAIPTDSFTFDQLYDLCYMNSEGSGLSLEGIAGGSWLTPALDAVIRRKRGYEKILMLPFVGAHNADVGEMIPCIVSDLEQRAPSAYRKAAARLPAEARKLLCPECC